MFSVASRLRRNYFKAYIQLLRPHQWIKNSFVFVGIFFASRWNSLFLVKQAGLTFIAFCLIASAVYTFNDCSDIDTDRQHPGKKTRGLANQVIAIKTARVIGTLLASMGLLLGWIVSNRVGYLLIIYLLLNAVYTYRLKHVVILDVFCIAGSFMLRLFSGTYGLEIPPSHWLVLCGLMLTLFLGFTKRRAELAVSDAAHLHRPVLAHYTFNLLDTFISITAGCTVLTYALYTISPETIYIHGSENLIYTVAFVIYGIFRYLYLIHFHQRGHDTARDLLHDKQLLITLLSWLLVTALCLTKS